MAAGLAQQLLLQQQAALGALNATHSSGAPSQPTGTHAVPAQAPGAPAALHVLTQRPASADPSTAAGGSPMHTQGNGGGGTAWKAATTPARKGMLHTLCMPHTKHTSAQFKAVVLCEE